MGPCFGRGDGLGILRGTFQERSFQRTCCFPPISCEYVTMYGVYYGRTSLVECHRSRQMAQWVRGYRRETLCRGHGHTAGPRNVVEPIAGWYEHVGISEFGSLHLVTVLFAPFLVYMVAIFEVIPHSFVTSTTTNLSAHIWGVIFHRT